MLHLFKSARWIALVPVGLYLILSVAYFLAVPVGESPDEPGHLQCVEQFALYNRLPIAEPPSRGEWWMRESIISGRMCYHMPLYYVVGGYLQRAIARFSHEPLNFEFPPSRLEFGTARAFFYHEDKASFWRVPEPATLIGLRILSIGLGLTMLWASYRVALAVYPGEEWIAIGAATLVAGWPQFLFLSRAISNDLLAAAMAVSTLVVLLKPGKPDRFLVAAILAALALLTKLSVFYVAAIVFGVWLLEFSLTKSDKRAYLKVGLACLLVWASAFLILVYQPTVQANLRSSLTQFAGISDEARTFSYWWAVFLMTLSSGWARLGWMNLPAPLWHAYLWWSGISLGLILSIRNILHHRARETGRIRLRLVVLAIWAAAIAISYVRINMNRFQPQFRFALALLPLLAALAAGGYLPLLGGRTRLNRSFVFVLAFSLLAYNVWIILAVIRPAYGWHF